jgi:membrane-associated phospholipid phosphatase
MHFLSVIVLPLALAAAAPAAQPSMLSRADLDPALVLPPPPAPGSDQAQRELRELRQVDAARTPTAEAAATLDGKTKDASIFREALGPRFDLNRLPATARLFAIVRATEKDAADRGKVEFRRERPWIVDPKLHTCSRNDDPRSSYPSGHTTMAFSMAAVLVRLVPAKADRILTRAASYGESRIICDQHFRSDVTAGQSLGLLVAERLMAKPQFMAAFQASRAELVRAGIATP